MGRKSERIRRRFSVRTSNVAATEIAQKFAKAITAHDTDGLSKLMSSDHVFVDSLGNRFPASTMVVVSSFLGADRKSVQQNRLSGRRSYIDGIRIGKFSSSPVSTADGQAKAKRLSRTKECWSALGVIVALPTSSSRVSEIRNKRRQATRKRFETCQKKENG
jgi:hypothetical protein